MTTVIQKPCTHREETPARRCLSCGCWLRSFHDAETCDPCGRPEWELTTPRSEGTPQEGQAS